MIGKKTLESEPIPAAKVKEILEDFSEKHELSYEQNLSLAHATSLNKLSLEHTEKLIEELEAYMTHKQAIRVADIIPRDMADLRLIFAKERNAPSNDEMKEILEIIEKYENWEIRSFTSKEVSLFREIEANCNDHFVLKEKDGFIAIYNKVTEDNINLKEVTDIDVLNLPSGDIENLKEGIYVYGQDELSSLIEDFNS